MMSIGTVLMLAIRRYLWFDAPPLRFLARMAPASSARGGASALRDGDPGAAAGSSVPFIASIIMILLALIFAAVGGGGLVLVRRFQSRRNISAASPSLGANGSVAALTVSAIR